MISEEKLAQWINANVSADGFVTIEAFEEVLEWVTTMMYTIDKNFRTLEKVCAAQQEVITALSKKLKEYEYD